MPPSTTGAAAPFFLFCSRTRFHRGDMGLMAAGYAPDTRIFGMDGEVLAAGRDEIRALSQRRVRAKFNPPLGDLDSHRGRSVRHRRGANLRILRRTGAGSFGDLVSH